VLVGAQALAAVLAGAAVDLEGDADGALDQAVDGGGDEGLLGDDPRVSDGAAADVAREPREDSRAGVPSSAS
jgi:hypothetical protein